MSAQTGTPIRSLTVLPALREDVELHTADGLTLVGELALPVGADGSPVTPAATLVTLHPLPTHGGYMDSHLLRKASWRLPALAGMAVLRFNTRGTTSPRGTSQGTFDEGVGERFDVAAALELAEFRDLPRIWLVAVSAIRQSGGTRTTVSVISWLTMPPPRLPEIATASRIEGKAKKTSIVRMITILMRPP